MVSAIVGVAGLEATYEAVRAGKTVGLANKECLVAAGELITAEARKQGKPLLPIDSEHNAVHQCLRGGRMGGSAEDLADGLGRSLSKTLEIRISLDYRTTGVESSYLEDGETDHHRLGHADE